jgi:hypothetical protein
MEVNAGLRWTCERCVEVEAIVKHGIKALPPRVHEQTGVLHDYEELEMCERECDVCNSYTSEWKLGKM